MKCIIIIIVVVVVSHLMSLCAASLSSEAIPVSILDTVRKAARLAVKVDMMTTEKNQKPATSRRDARLRGGSPPPDAQVSDSNQASK